MLFSPSYMRSHNTIYTCIAILGFYSYSLIEMITTKYYVHETKQNTTNGSKKVRSHTIDTHTPMQVSELVWDVKCIQQSRM